MCSIVAVQNGRDFRDYLSSDDWSTTTGQFTVLPGQSNIKTFGVQYQYTVENQDYLGNRVFFFTRFQFASPADSYNLGKEWVGDKKLGDQVTVYYHPQLPERSVLNTGWYPKGLLYFGATFLGTLIVILGPIILITGYFAFLKRFFKGLFSN